MKLSSVIRQIEKKPVRLFKLLWHLYGRAQFYTKYEAEWGAKFRLQDRVTLNEFETIIQISYLLEQKFTGYDALIDWEIAAEIYVIYKERLQKYLNKKWQEHHKEWLANDNRDKRQLFREAVGRGFLPQQTIKFEKGFWYIKFHIGHLYYPKKFKTQGKALKFREGIGIIGYTGAVQITK